MRWPISRIAENIPRKKRLDRRQRPKGERTMPINEKSKVTRKQLIDGLNDDLSREYQAIISYVNYSQVLKGAAYMNIADELAVHAKEELTHALKIANLVDYLGGMPSVTPKSVKTSDKAEDMLKFDLATKRRPFGNTGVALDRPTN